MLKGITIFFWILGVIWLGVAIFNMRAVEDAFNNQVLATDKIIVMVNKVRYHDGLKDLKWNEELTKSANMKACDIYSKKYWSHTTPDGISPWSFFRAVGYDYKYAGENLCRNENDVKCMKLWMLSPKHRQNILSDKYQDIGIGRCENITVQHFGTKE